MKKKFTIKGILIGFILITVFPTMKSQIIVQTLIEENLSGSTNYGFSVSGAGDVNNDGYDDVIVGANNFYNSSGRAYIYLGGSVLNEIADIIITGKNQASNIGISVSGAGDVNNDGYDDVIVGCHGFNTYIYYGGANMDEIADVSLIDDAMSPSPGTTINTGFGYSVSNAGDVNGDGFDDVIVGSPYSINSNMSRAYIFLGGSNMDGISDKTIFAEAVNDNFGFSVSGAGDVNNDGFDDVIVGAYRNDGSKGKAYLYFGGNTMDVSADVIMVGESTSNYFGYSVSDAKDVNNDGYDDVIVGANYYNSRQGRSYVYFGGSSMNNTADVIMTGVATNNYFGSSVSSVGDLNNDGFDDVVVGSYGYSSNQGRAYIYYGSSSMDNTVDLTLTGELINSYFGNAVSGAGDVNNDGFDDIFIGAYGYNNSNGRSYIYLGATNMDNSIDVTMNGEKINSEYAYSVSGAGDVNNDGYDDIIVGSRGYNRYQGRAYLYFGGSVFDNVADVIMTGGDVNYNFGGSVAAAGDVNNDGFDDVIVGSSLSKGSGRAHIYFGGNTMDNVADVTMIGETSFGISVSGAGDVNNDGFDDVIIGANQYNNWQGRAYLFLGGVTMDNIVDVTMTGIASINDFGSTVSDAGDVNGDGYDDVIVGTNKTNGSAGYAYIYLGGSIMDNIADVTLKGTGNRSGCFVSNAGDVNNDGFDDVMTGDSYMNGDYTIFRARAYIYLGGTNMDSIPDVTMSSDNSSNFFNVCISYLGDINNDGFSDVALGNPGFNKKQGRVYVYFGGNNMDSIPDGVLTGEAIENYFGISISDLGDVNNDGFDDIIIGAHEFLYNGKAYLYISNSSSLTTKNQKIDLLSSDFKIFQGNDRFIYVQSESKSLLEGDITVLDMQGKNLFKTKITGTKTKIDKVFAPGVYVVSVNQNGLLFNKKIFVSSF